jgi:hypothetical protein
LNELMNKEESEEDGSFQWMEVGIVEGKEGEGYIVGDTMS